MKRAPGFDAERTSIFICNHVNLFDAFVIYSAIPQFVRGLELDSHFKIPAYGWMMKRFGNIPVSRGGGPSQFKKTLEQVRSHLANGISVIIFAEGTRTLDGRVGPFEKVVRDGTSDRGARRSYEHLRVLSIQSQRKLVVEAIHDHGTPA